MNKFKLSVAALLIASASYGQSHQCRALTKDSVQCKNKVKYVEGNDQQYPLCYLHDKNYVKKTNVKANSCNGTTGKGKKCKNKTTHKSGFCHHHRNNNNKK